MNMCKDKNYLKISKKTYIQPVQYNELILRVYTPEEQYQQETQNQTQIIMEPKSQILVVT